MSTIDKFAIMLKPSLFAGWMWFITIENVDNEIIATGTAKIYTDASEQAFQTMQELKKRAQS